MAWAQLLFGAMAMAMTMAWVATATRDALTFPPPPAESISEELLRFLGSSISTGLSIAPTIIILCLGDLTHMPQYFTEHSLLGEILTSMAWLYYYLLVKKSVSSLDSILAHAMVAVSNFDRLMTIYSVKKEKKKGSIAWGITILSILAVFGFVVWDVKPRKSLHVLVSVPALISYTICQIMTCLEIIQGSRTKLNDILTLSNIAPNLVLNGTILFITNTLQPEETVPQILAGIGFSFGIIELVLFFGFKGTRLPIALGHSDIEMGARADVTSQATLLPGTDTGGNQTVAVLQDAQTEIQSDGGNNDNQSNGPPAGAPETRRARRRSAPDSSQRTPNASSSQQETPMARANTMRVDDASSWFCLPTRGRGRRGRHDAAP